MNKKNHNQKHLTLSDRVYIEQELLQGSTFCSIANILHKDPSTISKEIRLHAMIHQPSSSTFLSEARRAADGDDEVLGRIARLQFGMDLGRFSARKRLGRPSKPTAAEDEAHRRMIADYLARDPSAFRASQLGIK